MAQKGMGSSPPMGKGIRHTGDIKGSTPFNYETGDLRRGFSSRSMPEKNSNSPDGDYFCKDD